MTSTLVNTIRYRIVPQFELSFAKTTGGIRQVRIIQRGLLSTRLGCWVTGKAREFYKDFWKGLMDNHSFPTAKANTAFRLSVLKPFRPLPGQWTRVRGVISS